MKGRKKKLSRQSYLVKDLTPFIKGKGKKPPKNGVQVYPSKWNSQS